MAALLLLVTITPSSASLGLRGKGPAFLEHCVAGMACQGLRCEPVAGGRHFSLELLQDLPCSEDASCRREETGLTCVKGSCVCPTYQAMNVSSCSCEVAARCEDGGECKGQHSGRRCADPYCTCLHSAGYASLLVDPSSLFCVLPHTGTPLEYGTEGLTVLCVVGGLACIVLLVVLGMVLHKNCVCEKGAYECADVPDAPDLPHVAAWDHPSLDYIPKTEEEDIVFTLAMAKDTVRMSNASTIHVMDELVTDYNENRGYVDDVDDPRHD